MAFQDFTLTKLGQAAIGTSAATLYTVPAATRALVKCIDIGNTTGSAMTVSVHLVPSGGSPGTGNVLIPAVALSANSILHWEGAQVLNTGDFISTIASATGSTITASGAEAI